MALFSKTWAARIRGSQTMETIAQVHQAFEESKVTLELLTHTTRYYEGDTVAKDTVSNAIQELAASLTNLNDGADTARSDDAVIIDACLQVRDFLRARGINLPEELLQPQKTASKTAESDEKRPPSAQDFHQDTGLGNGKIRPLTAHNADDGKIASNTDERVIDLLTLEEFETVPKYMRGRMSAGEVNAVVAKMDHLLREKRHLMESNFRRLSKVDKDRVIAWREQETADTANQLFCIEKELHLAPKESAQLRAVIPILRHTRRIVEVRGKGLIRFAVIR